MFIEDLTHRVVMEEGPTYEEMKSDPFGVVRALLEDHERRIRALEEELARQKKE